MRYLLDTHTLIWYLEDDVRLSSYAKSIIEDDKNEILTSVVSFWEMAIKINLGKLGVFFFIRFVDKTIYHAIF